MESCRHGVGESELISQAGHVQSTIDRSGVAHQSQVAALPCGEFVCFYQYGQAGGSQEPHTIEVQRRLGWAATASRTALAKHVAATVAATVPLCVIGGF